jgi:hypothetical protein
MLRLTSQQTLQNEKFDLFKFSPNVKTERECARFKLSLSCLRILVEANVAMERASFCGINIFGLASLMQASAPPNKLTLMRTHRKGQAV